MTFLFSTEPILTKEISLNTSSPSHLALIKLVIGASECFGQNHTSPSKAFALLFKRAWGPFLESPETLRAIFGCHNSLFISRTEMI